MAAGARPAHAAQSSAASGEKPVRRVLLLPPRVEYYHSTVEMTQGQPSQRADAKPGASEEAARVLGAITSEVLEESGVTVTPAELLPAPPDAAAAAAVEESMRQIFKRFDERFLPQPGQDLPTGQFEMPREAGRLANWADAGALVLVRGMGMSRSGGSRALGAVTSLSKGSKDEIEVHIAVIDGVTGRVTARTRTSIDSRLLNDADQLHRVLAEKMKDFALLKK